MKPETDSEDIILQSLKKAYFDRMKINPKKFDEQREKQLDLLEDAIRERQLQILAPQNYDTDT